MRVHPRDARTPALRYGAIIWLSSGDSMKSEMRAKNDGRGAALRERSDKAQRVPRRVTATAGAQESVCCASMKRAVCAAVYGVRRFSYERRFPRLRRYTRV